MGTATPAEWARSKRDRLERRATGEVRGYLDAAVEVVMPGVPIAAVLGFAANGGTNENTTGWISCSESERREALTLGRKPLGGDPRDGYGSVDGDDLHELGPFGVEGGHVPELVAGPGSVWYGLASSAEVRKILGRDAVTGARWHGAVADQYAVGVANLARHSESIRAKLHALDPRLAWDADREPLVLAGDAPLAFDAYAVPSEFEVLGAAEGRRREAWVGGDAVDFTDPPRATRQFRWRTSLASATGGELQVSLVPYPRLGSRGGPCSNDEGAVIHRVAFAAVPGRWIDPIAIDFNALLYPPKKEFATQALALVAEMLKSPRLDAAALEELRAQAPASIAPQRGAAEPVLDAPELVRTLPPPPAPPAPPATPE